MDSHGIRGVYVPSLWLKDHVPTLNQGFLALGVNAIPYMRGPGGGCHYQLVLLRLQYGSTEFSSQIDVKTFVKIASLFIKRGSNPPSERFQCSNYLLSTSCERIVLASKRTRDMPLRLLTFRDELLTEFSSESLQ